jgi:hypothetical protein
MSRRIGQVLSIRNEDGQVSVFRLVCLLVAAGCMLAYGIVLCMSGDAPSNGGKAAARQEQAAAVEEDDSDDEEKTAENVRAMAFRELDEADEYYRECGSFNEGFVGCDWKFSPSVSKYYEGRSVAVDDGFAITLSAKPGNPDRSKCALLEVTSGGSRTSLDAKGNASSCFPAENPQVANASEKPASVDAGNGKI